MRENGPQREQLARYYRRIITTWPFADIAELKDEDGGLEAAVGDRIQAVVVSTPDGLQLSMKLARGAATARQLEDALRSGLPVEGKVDKEVKGVDVEKKRSALRRFRKARRAPERQTQNPNNRI